eukprot:scaffold10110_cov69-Phaeocystis_antarctica.AAC.2
MSEAHRCSPNDLPLAAPGSRWHPLAPCPAWAHQSTRSRPRWLLRIRTAPELMLHLLDRATCRLAPRWPSGCSPASVSDEHECIARPHKQPAHSGALLCEPREPSGVWHAKTRCTLEAGLSAGCSSCCSTVAVTLFTMASASRKSTHAQASAPLDKAPSSICEAARTLENWRQ